jgi:hypothetical protein
MNGTSKVGQEDDGMLKNARTASQDCQYMIASIGLTGQVTSTGLQRQNFQHTTSGNRTVRADFALIQC